MKEYTPVKEGKVREIYDLGNELVMVATDRISAFDVILKNKITKKGTVLTQMSKFWFDYTKDILPNHMISVDPEDMPEFFRGEDYCGNSMLVKKLTMLPIECIVRGYITGSGWASYKKNGTVCGIKLPEGLSECDKLPEPIYTPSTKAEIGDHDENISFEQSIAFWKSSSPDTASNTPRSSATARSRSTRSVRITRSPAGSSSRIQSSSSVWTKTEMSSSATKCSPRTPAASGRFLDMSRAMASRPSTSSSSVTG